MAENTGKFMVLKAFNKNGRTHYGYFSQSNPKKLLEDFGTKKPSREKLLHTQRRVQFYKHQTTVKDHSRKNAHGTIYPVSKHVRRL